MDVIFIIALLAFLRVGGPIISLGNAIDTVR